MKVGFVGLGKLGLPVALAVEKILGKPQERIGEPPLVSNRVAA